MVKGVYKNCLQCNKKFYVRKSRVRIKFCSVNCFHQWQKENPYLTKHSKRCINCKKIYHLTSRSSKKRRITQKYCSPSCYRNSEQGKELKRKFTKRFTYLIGIKNPNWKGGIAYLPYPIEWKTKLRKKILKRDKNICQMCGRGNRRLNVHHIDYNKSNCSSENLVLLCNKCHGRTNFRRIYWRNFLSAKPYEESYCK